MNKKIVLYSVLFFAVFFSFNMNVLAETICCSRDGKVIEGIQYSDSSTNACLYQGNWVERSQCTQVCCDLNTGRTSSNTSNCQDETHAISSERACQDRYNEYKSIKGDEKCVDKDVKSLLSTAKKIYKFMEYITPAILVIMGSVDFMRATISSSADEMEKNKKRFFNRLGLAALVFLVFAIVQLVMNLLEAANIVGSSSWVNCWNTLMMFK